MPRHIFSRRLALPALVLFAMAGAIADQPAVTEQALREANSVDPQAWRQLAIDARTAGDLELAASALQKAEALGLPPVNAGFERARQHVARGDSQAAIDELQALADGGFTAIAAITGDPVLKALSGNEAYSALIKNMEKGAYPCAHQQRFRDFDFWLGEWDVHLANGTFAGTNSIKANEKGCVLVEKWASAGGGTGHSINYLDGSSGEWVQVWNDAAGSQIDIRGRLTDKGMRLTGQIHYLGNDTTFPFRALWTPLEDGRVRQFFEQSNDQGVSWTPWFEGFYSRRSIDSSKR
ncbi:MAG: hypothetical protein HKN35_05615 [Woeseia sp.]|nr:hypothetical protein [Woeseia sp.]NNE60347.1 hypothetical protein [Woeseia sp.]NNL54652.1 hypothetical protein [Woeseia sp.]